MNSNIDFQSACLEIILFSSIEVNNFSSRLYFSLANIKLKFGIYMYVTSSLSKNQGQLPSPLIFLYMGISALYLLYDQHHILRKYLLLYIFDHLKKLKSTILFLTLWGRGVFCQFLLNTCLGPRENLPKFLYIYQAWWSKTRSWRYG